MIYILEGPDGVGKTTLARAIQDKTKGHILHCTWKEEFNMEDYFTDILDAAIELEPYQDVVIDRWAPSEWVYGHVFRGGPAFDVFDFIKEKVLDENIPVKWIMCRNNNAVLNHKKNMKEREEMFEDMTDVVANFMLFENDTPELNWVEYNFDKVKMEDWVDEHITRR